MAHEILAPLAEFIGNVVFAVHNWKRQGVFPGVSLLGAGMLFAFLGGLFALMLRGLAPDCSPLAVVLGVTLGAIAIAFASKRAGVQLGFLLTPARGVALAVLVAVGATGVLYLANAL